MTNPPLDDATRLEEIKEYARDGIYADDAVWLLSQAEKLAKVEDALRAAEEALSWYADLDGLQGRKYYKQKSVAVEQGLMTEPAGYRAKEALKRIRGEE